MDALCSHGGNLVEALNTNVYGNGTQTLILSHGFGTDQSVWHYLIPYLAYYFKVVVFDLVFAPNVCPNLYDPNRYSNLKGYAQDLVCLLDQLNVNKTIYLGHSMSAMIGCIAARRRPELFQHLILLGGSPRYINAEGYNGGFERPEINTILRKMNQNFTNWVQNFAPEAISVNNATAVSEFKKSLMKMEPKIALSVAQTVFLKDLRKIMPQVVVPCTIIQSEKDIIVPTFVAYYMERELGGDASVEILKTQGHFPQLTAPSLLLKVINKVLCIKG